MVIYLFIYFTGSPTVIERTMDVETAAAGEQNLDHDKDGDEGWPMCDKVLLSLSEDVRPVKAALVDGDDGHDVVGTVADRVQSCMAERVVPTMTGLMRFRPPPSSGFWSGRVDGTTVMAARRLQTRLMAVRSAYVDGKYYAPEGPYISRTVEELQWPQTVERPPLANANTYVVGTVLHDEDTSACHLLGLRDPQTRVPVDCTRLSATLPRHRSTVKMFAELRTSGVGGANALAPHHFQIFSCADLFQ